MKVHLHKSLRPCLLLLAAAVMQSAWAASPATFPPALGAQPLAQLPGAQSLAQSPAAPAPAAQPALPLNQSLSIAAGTGVLLQLSQPAATVLSADPTVARVQPASPTSLFLMGVSPGETTVIATNQAGAAIVQYNIRVTPGVGRPPAAPTGIAQAVPSGPVYVTSAAARAAQASIAQSVVGAQDVQVRATGTQLVLTGRFPTRWRRSRQTRSLVPTSATRQG